MELPVQITYRGVTPSEALSRLIRKEARKLDEFFDRIVSCRVLVEREQRHLRSGAPFRVRIDLTVPGKELAVDTARNIGVAAADAEKPMRRKAAEVDAMHKDPELTVRDAFRRARRRIQDHARRMMATHTRSSLALRSKSK